MSGTGDRPMKKKTTYSDAVLRDGRFLTQFLRKPSSETNSRNFRESLTVRGKALILHSCSHFHETNTFIVG